MRLPVDSVVVDRPIDAVFAFVADPTHDPRWHTTVVRSERSSTGPPGPGSTFEGVYDSHKRTLDTPADPSNAQPIRAELVEWEPARHSRLRVRFVNPPRGVGARILGRSFDLTFDFGPAPGGGTMVHRGGEIHPTALIRPLLPLFLRFNAKRSAYLLGLLKAAAEAAIPAA